MEKSQILNSVIFLFTVELQEYHFSGGMDKCEVWTAGTHIQAPKPVVEPTYGGGQAAVPDGIGARERPGIVHQCSRTGGSIV